MSENTLRERLEDKSLNLANLLEILYKMEEVIGSHDMLDNLARAMGTDALRENLEYLARMFDL